MDRIIAKLGQVWCRVPYWCLAWLIVNLAPAGPKASDTEIEAELDRLLALDLGRGYCWCGLPRPDIVILSSSEGAAWGGEPVWCGHLHSCKDRREEAGSMWGPAAALPPRSISPYLTTP